MKEAIDRGKYEYLIFTVATASKACPLELLDISNVTAADIFTAGLDTIIDKSYFPANNCYFYTNAMLSSYIPDSNTELFSSEWKGSPKGVIVAVSSSV